MFLFDLIYNLVKTFHLKRKEEKTITNTDQKERINTSTHANRYVSLMFQTRNKQYDADYQSAVYLLSSSKQIFNISNKYIDLDGIDFPKIKRSIINIDESEQLIIDIAHNLFSYKSKCTATPFEISRLDSSLMEDVYTALKIAGGNVNIIIKQALSNNYELILDDSRYQENKRISAMFKSMLNSSEIFQNPEKEKQIDPSSLLSDKLEQAKIKANQNNSKRDTVINKKDLNKNL